MSVVAVAAGFAQWLGSAAGQAATLEILGRLHPEQRVIDAIDSLPPLTRPRRQGELMPQLDLAKLSNAPIQPSANGFSVAVLHPESGEQVQVGITWEEVVSALPLVIDIYGTVKVAAAARPTGEDGLVKATYAAEAGFPKLMALTRQIIQDVRD